MKKILSATLITLLLFATAMLTVGCGGNEQSDFERAEQLVNDTFDSLEAAIDELLGSVQDGISIDDVEEFTERAGAIGEDMEDRLEAIESEMDALSLTDEEEERIEELAMNRLETLMDRLGDLQEEMMEALLSTL